MVKWYSIMVLIFATQLFFPRLLQGLEYPPNFTFIKVADPLSGKNPIYRLKPRPKPTPGRSFRDPHFGAILTRVTTATNTRHEYSRFDPFNINQSMIVLHTPKSGDFWIYRTKSVPYNQNANIVRGLDIAEPRWDQKDKDVIWGLSTVERSFQILKMNVATGQSSVVKDFALDPVMGPIIKSQPDLYRITTKNEGEASQDFRFWALFLQGTKDDYRLRYIFTWDRQLDKVLGLYNIPAAEAELLDWVGMSPLGKWVLIGGDLDTQKRKLAGLIMSDKNLTKFHRLAFATAHSDVGLDAQGNEVIVMQNNRTDYIDLIPINLGTQMVTKEDDYKKSSIIPLIRLFYSSESPVGLKSGVHISCNLPGYCVVSTYIESGINEQNWLDRTISLIRLDRNKPQVYYLAKVTNTTKAYWEETQATITRDGAKVVWASNWNQNVGREKVFLIQLDMHKNWQQLISHGNP